MCTEYAISFNVNFTNLANICVKVTHNSLCEPTFLRIRQLPKSLIFISITIMSKVLKFVQKNIVKLIAIFIIILIVSISLILWPFINDLIYFIDQPDPKTISYSLSSSTLEKLGLNSSEVKTENKPAPAGNRLIIPKIGVDAAIIEGDNLDVLKKQEGVWHKNHSVFDPGKDNSGTVLAGHRFQYLPPNTATFYNLDKLKVGDKFIVFWQKKEMVFEIFEAGVVKATDIDSVKYTGKNNKEVALYTCTPIGTNTDRIVVKAKEI